MKNILIGTMCVGNDATAEYIRNLGNLGFESTEITFGHNCQWLIDSGKADEYAAGIREAITGSNMELSALGVYGNPLESDEDAKKTLNSWHFLIDNCHKFGTNLICGFTGGLTNKALPESIPAFKAVFSELAAHAKEKNVRIAFENCNMGGSWHAIRWNIALHPRAWELMFAAVDSDNLGLEWEPAHQLSQLIDPIPQLREWAEKIFHIHGKDATVDRASLARYGIIGDIRCIGDRTPGFGDSNWTDIISILRIHHYEGNIDIEGWHDPVYRGELEMTGQVAALKYLKQCRGGDFVPNF